MKEEIERILSEAEIKLVYTEEEYKEIERRARNVVSRIEQKIKDINVKGRPLIAGSLAKKTMIKGFGDIDIFILLKPEYTKDKLQQLVVKLGDLIFGEGNYWMRYADHPYIETEIDGFTYSVVPAYEVNKGEWISPVDRTVYHLEYIRSKTFNNALIRRDMTLLKAFMRRIGVYGAEVYISGFSGYLCELLVLNYGSLIKLFIDVLNWKPPVVIDVEKYYLRNRDVLRLFDQPLIVIDPIDKSRNVASAVSERSFAIFISAVKHFMEKPNIEYFNLWRPIKAKEMKLPEGTHLLGIIFSHEAEIPDVIYSQIRRIAKKVVKQLMLHGFHVLKWEIYSNCKDRSLILISTANIEVPKVHIRAGPKTYMKTEKDFISKNKDKFIWIDEDGRWKVIDKIEVTNIVNATNNALQIISIPEKLLIREPLILADNELFRYEVIRPWIKQFMLRREFWVDLE